MRNLSHRLQKLERVVMIARRVTVFVVGLLLMCVGAFTQVPSDAEIRKSLADRIGAENLGSGIVVGVVDANGRRVVAYGSLNLFRSN